MYLDHDPSTSPWLETELELREVALACRNVAAAPGRLQRLLLHLAANWGAKEWKGKKDKGRTSLSGQRRETTGDPAYWRARPPGRVGAGEEWRVASPPEGRVTDTRSRVTRRKERCGNSWPVPCIVRWVGWIVYAYSGWPFPFHILRLGISHVFSNLRKLRLIGVNSQLTCWC